MARFRQHRGSLADSLKTTVDVADVAALKAHIRMLWECTWWAEARLDPEAITIKPYSGDDDRCGWKNVHVVSDAAGVIGFVEGDVLAPPAAAAAECPEWCGQELADGRILRCERCDGRFRPSARQLELMDHAVGGDSRHRNRFLAAGDDIAPWRGLVSAGLAFEDPAFGHGGMVSFHVTDAGLALLDARARPRILRAKAAAWDAWRAVWDDLGEVVPTVPEEIIEFMERAGKMVPPDPGTVGGAPEPGRNEPAPKGPRALAEDIVAALMFEGNLPVTLASQAVTLMFGGHPAARENVTATIAEIIRKALGGAS